MVPQATACQVKVLSNGNEPEGCVFPAGSEPEGRGAEIIGSMSDTSHRTDPDNRPDWAPSWRATNRLTLPHHRPHFRLRLRRPHTGPLRVTTTSGSPTRGDWVKNGSLRGRPGLFLSRPGHMPKPQRRLTRTPSANHRRGAPANTPSRTTTRPPPPCWPRLTRPPFGPAVTFRCSRSTRHRVIPSRQPLQRSPARRLPSASCS